MQRFPSREEKVYDVNIEDDENLFELQIKNLDTNEVIKM